MNQKEVIDNLLTIKRKQVAVEQLMYELINEIRKGVKE